MMADKSQEVPNRSASESERVDHDAESRRGQVQYSKTVFEGLRKSKRDSQASGSQVGYKKTLFKDLRKSELASFIASRIKDEKTFACDRDVTRPPEPRDSNKEKSKTSKADSTLAHIPKQTQITRDLAAKLQKRGQQQRRLYQLRVAAGRTAIAVLILTGPAVWFGYAFLPADSAWKQSIDAAFASNEDDDVQPRITATKPENDQVTGTLRLLLEKGTAADLIKYAEKRSSENHGGDLTSTLLINRDRIQVADRVLELNYDDNANAFAASEKIDALIALAYCDAHQHLRLADVKRQLGEFSSLHLPASDPKLNLLARLGLLNSKIHFYLEDDSNENYEAITNSLTEVFRDVANKFNGHFLLIDELLGLIPDQTRKTELKQKLATHLMASSQPELRDAGVRVNDELLLGEVDLAVLQQLIPRHDASAIEELKSLVAAVEKSPDVSFLLYLNIFTLIDALNGQHEEILQRQLQASIESAGAIIADETTRDQVGVIVRAAQIRRELIGKQFKFDSGATSEQNFDADSPVTLVVFVNSSIDETANWLATLKNCLVNHPQLQVVLVCSDESPKRETSQANIQTMFPDAILIPDNFNRRYIEQCPVSWQPYLLLLDQQQKVTSLNLRLNHVAAAVTKLKRRQSVDE